MQSLHSFLLCSGFRKLDLQLVTTGAYLPTDSEWNYSDIPHLNYVHTKVDGYTLLAEKNNIHSLFLQRVGPLLLPAAVSIFHHEPGRHDYIMSLLNVIIVVATTHEPFDCGCKTTTSYAFYYRGLFGYLVAFGARLMTRRNYKTLMSEDLPMRNQRGLLRRRGVRFAYDDQELIGFAETNDVSQDHVDASNLCRKSESSTITIQGLTGHRTLEDFLIELFWYKDTVILMPLICPHEGAPLGRQQLKPNHLAECPWHGRRVAKLATLNRGEQTKCSISFCNQSLIIELRPTESFQDGSETLTIRLKHPVIGG